MSRLSHFYRYLLEGLSGDTPPTPRIASTSGSAARRWWLCFLAGLAGQQLTYPDAASGLLPHVMLAPPARTKAADRWGELPYAPLKINSRDKDLRGVHLVGADLENADLRGVDLTGASLMGARLTGARLTNAVLAEAFLTNADLRFADLEGADLSHAGLIGADLQSAKLAGARLTGARLVRASLKDADLGGADLADASLSRTNLEGTDLSGVELDWKSEKSLPRGITFSETTKWGTTHAAVLARRASIILRPGVYHVQDDNPEDRLSNVHEERGRRAQ